MGPGSAALHALVSLRKVMLLTSLAHPVPILEGDGRSGRSERGRCCRIQRLPRLWPVAPSAGRSSSEVVPIAARADPVPGLVAPARVG
eukprot:878825-Pyramimonas_sp.AAC.1